MARIAGVDLPREKRVEIALTYIYGIGRSTSQEILSKAGVDFNTRSDNLTEEEDRYQLFSSLDIDLTDTMEFHADALIAQWRTA